jgi:predicted metal-dependent HD superfamily phosphohydrolase
MDNILNKTSKYVTNLLSEKLSKDMYYHSLAHTQEVVANAKEIGENSGLSSEEMELVLLAAWFHDTGFTNSYEGHENTSLRIAENFLSKNNYPSEKINKIINAIKITNLTFKPENLIENVIRDADLYYLGTTEFFNQYELLRKEWCIKLNKIYTEIEWLELNIDFFFSHVFYTEYANKKLSPQKEINLAKLKKILSINNGHKPVKDIK